MGSTEALTDGSGNIVASYKYDIFGAVRASTGSGSAEYRFTGQQDDGTLGYTYLRARYYDPQTGRFVSKDPFAGVLTNPASQHYYGYAQNNAVNWTDPSGKCLPLCGLMAGGAVVGGILAFTGSVIAQTGTGMLSGKSLQDSFASVDYGDAFIAGGVGAVAGALAPFAALNPGAAGVVGQYVVGFGAGAAQYGITKAVHNEPMEPGWMLTSAALGAGGVWVAGTLPTAPANALRPALEGLWVDQANAMLRPLGFARLIGGGAVAGVDAAKLLSQGTHQVDPACEP